MDSHQQVKMTILEQRALEEKYSECEVGRYSLVVVKLEHGK